MAAKNDDQRKSLRPEIEKRRAERSWFRAIGFLAFFLPNPRTGADLAASNQRLSRYGEWKQRRRALHEGKVLAREAKRGERRYAHRLAPETREQINAAVKAFEAAEKGGRDEAAHDALIDAVNGLDKVLDTYLSFARKSTLREYAEAIGTAVLIALFLRAFVVEAFKIPSGSMIPTLQVGDHIFVNKFIYGVRIPFTNIKIGTEIRKPRRGEVIVFIYPKDPDKDFIKRIVAVAGDVVEMREGVLYVNKVAVDHQPVDSNCQYEDYAEDRDRWDDLTCDSVVEKVGPNQYTTIYDKVEPEFASLRTTTPFTVPEHSVFCQGDNRDHSSDSRVWGAVDESLIKGKAMVIWWSQGDADRQHRSGSLEWMKSIPIFRLLYGARYSRMFQLVR